MVERSQPLDEAIPLGALAGIIATVSVFAVAQGLTYPLLSFILQRQGVPPGLIGVSAAMTPIGFIVSAPLVPWLARRFGAGRTALACAALAILLLALIGAFQQFWLWLPLRFLLGCAVNPLYIVSETWMIALAPPSRRGRLMGIYASLISAGFAGGPLILTLVGTQGWPPFLVGIAAFALCAACLALVLPRLPPVHAAGSEGSVLTFAPRARVLLFAVLVTAGFEQVVLALLGVYGAAHGSGEARVAALLALMIAGNIALQIPLGMAAERLGAARVGTLCAYATAFGALLLPFVFDTPAIWPMLFVWGAISYAIYTMALIELGERFSGAMMVAGNAAFSVAWGVGGITGPPVAGAAMGWFGPEGMPLVLGVSVLMLALLRQFSGQARARKGPGT